MVGPCEGESKVSTATERRVRSDALAAIIAALVGLLALLVAGFTAYIQRQQVRAQVWPYLQMGKSDAQGNYELIAVNKGVGPVIVQSVQLLADGKPMSSWKSLNRLFGFKETDAVVTDTLNRTVLAPGDQLHWIAFQNAADVHAFVDDWVRFHVQARVCDASTLGDGWLVIFGAKKPSTSRAIASCPKLSDSVQFVD